MKLDETQMKLVKKTFPFHWKARQCADDTQMKFDRSGKQGGLENMRKPV